MSKLKMIRPHWPRLILSLLMFLAVLVATDMILIRLTVLDGLVGEEQIQAGYMAAVRAQLFLLGLAAAVAMVPLLYQGITLIPLVWIINILLLGHILPGPWYDVANSRLFVSPVLNFLILALLPPLVGWSLGWSAREFRGFTPVRRLYQLALAPVLWLTVVTLAVAGNLFSWHWSAWFSLPLWPTGLGGLLLVAALPLFIIGGRRSPLGALLCYWLGMLLPLAFFWLAWGSPEATFTGLTMLLPGFGDSFLAVWLELLLIFALPLILVLGVNQWVAWRGGEEVIQLL